MRITIITTALLSLFIGQAHAAAVTASASIDLATLSFSQMAEEFDPGMGPPPPAELFSFTQILGLFNTSALAVDDGGVEYSDTSLNASASASAPGGAATASADYTGNTLTASSSASLGSALSGATRYDNFVVEYLEDWDFGGFIDVSVDYMMAAEDGDPNNPTFPGTDVFGEVGLNVFAFSGLESDPADADASLFTNLFGFGPQMTSGTLTGNLYLPPAAAGTTFTLVVETQAQSFAAAVPIPATLPLLMSALGGLAVLRRRKI